ncbi:uncharacterized protein FFM5_03039 [Fusarium fujikuroi]|nr:uncharacterized protein FFM5_03039 [Fusarium fujikuroi]
MHFKLLVLYNKVISLALANSQEGNPYKSRLRINILDT